ncbi:XRE family transcriptional regulator [Eubacterium ventriosum]|uniref:XRE family transcriptional regulator n=1 Tax=Eubacterium ventriosum TaxID=39496 RepID=A0A413RUT9_9FIRM|nr:helix-turn-helix transcriptional regulator [Eubacterium ventriosum]RHA52078.1 XRE family transcriptional regulator [Eubacterium ventriosum]
MSFGQNFQFLRKMRNKMTQEELAEKMGVMDVYIAIE